MKVAFDTSVVVPALVAAHPLHERSLVWLTGAVDGRFEGVASWHMMAEAWAVLTRLPLKPRTGSEQARTVLGRLEAKLALVAPTAALYRGALARAARRGARSGAIFDALHLVSAEKARADLLVTFNPADFTRLADGKSLRILEPPDPPRLDLA